MKAYMITPVLMIVIFIILGSFLFYSSELDLAKTKAIRNEMSFSKMLESSEKEEIKAGLIGFETLYTNKEISNKSQLEKMIQQEIADKTGLNAKVAIENSSDKSSLLNITLNLSNSVGNISINAVNFNYSVRIFYPSYDINYFYETFNPQKICDYASGCDFNETDFENYKKAETGYVWDYIENQPCIANTYNFSLKVFDENNFVSKEFPNKLQDRNDGDNYFKAVCP